MFVISTISEKCNNEISKFQSVDYKSENDAFTLFFCCHFYMFLEPANQAKNPKKVVGQSWEKEFETQGQTDRQADR